VLNSKVERGEERSLSSLAAIKLFYSYKPAQVVIVYKHLDCMRSALKVIAKLLKSLYDYKEFAVVGLVVLLCRY